MIKAESTTLVVMLTFGLTLANGGASVTGTQILVDDFNDGNDQGWSQFDYTAGEPFGPATFEVRNGAYHIASQGGHDASFNDYLFSLWDAEGSDAPFRNGYLQARVSADNANTIVGVIMRGTVDEEGRLVGYGFAASAKYGVMIIKRCDGATSAFITSDPYIGFGPGNDWFFKAGAIDDRLDFKVWRAGQTEPLRRS